MRHIMDHDPKDLTGPGHSNKPPQGNDPQDDDPAGYEEDDDMALNPEEIQEVIDLSDGEQDASEGLYHRRCF